MTITDSDTVSQRDDRRWEDPKKTTSDPRWKYFLRSKDAGATRAIAKCTFCHTQISARLGIMSLHMMKCPKITGDPKLDYIRGTMKSQPAVENAGKATSNSKTTISSGSVLHKYASRMTKERATELDIRLVRWLIHANIPLSFVENPHFKEFCASLDPTYCVPGRTKVTETILPMIYASTTLGSTDEVKDVRDTLVTPQPYDPNSDQYNFTVEDILGE